MKHIAETFQANPALKHIKWVLPHAPGRAVTANRGKAMPAWFDVVEFGSTDKEDETGMLETVSYLNGLIEKEVGAGVPPERVVLGGFSQGGAMTLLTGLTNERRLGGLVVLSGRLPLLNKFKSMAAPHSAQMPIFWGHGTSDAMITYQRADESVDFLTKELGFSRSAGAVTGLEFHPYAHMGHSTSPQELTDLAAWLKRVVPDAPLE
ncbi:Phospholipase/carboxylesterase [Athelia psychrophila]|uniref:Acyl-protein thioesterase 1 n=1 Tax=Athelia psychrophila TaxID=1759441 RepID=A0A167UHC8_9AGAM|nr:Phospholipase/carboxylesterase [Fibularhizoctonia sp. CBS 109695]